MGEKKKSHLLSLLAPAFLLIVRQLAAPCRQRPAGVWEQKKDTMTRPNLRDFLISEFPLPRSTQLSPRGREGCSPAVRDRCAEQSRIGLSKAARRCGRQRGGGAGRWVTAPQLPPSRDRASGVKWRPWGPLACCCSRASCPPAR